MTSNTTEIYFYYLLVATSSAVRIRTVNDKLIINDLVELKNSTTAKTANVWAKAFLLFEYIV